MVSAWRLGNSRLFLPKLGWLRYRNSRNVLGELRNVTVSQSGNILMAYGGTRTEPMPITGLRFRNNLVRHNQYGVHGSDRAPGADTLRSYFPGAVFQSNGIGGGDASRYPAGNVFLSEAEFESQFANAAAGDFRLRSNSRFRGAASDKQDLGADIGALAVAVGLRPGARIQ